jgi:hypothetical protein
VIDQTEQATRCPALVLHLGRRIVGPRVRSWLAVFSLGNLLSRMHVQRGCNPLIHWAASGINLVLKSHVSDFRAGPDLDSSGECSVTHESLMHVQHLVDHPREGPRGQEVFQNFQAMSPQTQCCDLLGEKILPSQ